jgi:hypothetical protein
MGVTNLKQRMPFRRWQFVGRAVAAAAFAKSQRTIVRHKMFREKIFRRPKPLGEEAPETPPADFRAETVKTLNEPFGVFARGLVYFGGNFEPIPDRCNFAEGNPRLRHSERAGIHSDENDALAAAAVFLQIQFMRSPRIVQGIINMSDRQAEFQTPGRNSELPVRGNEFAACFVFAHGQAYPSRECEPSQNGLFFECLHPHQATVPCAATSALTGERPVPLCEPSQKGCDFDRPQAHHQYEPGSAGWTKGNFWAMTGSFMRSF